MGRRLYSKVSWHGIVCLIVLLISASPSYAVSAGCAAHNITQSNGILAGLSIVNRNFSSTGLFEAGEVITFSVTNGPQVINVTSFKITETMTSTVVLNAAGKATAMFTIPTNGTFFFDVKISANNPGPNPGSLNYIRTCVAGVVTPPVAPPAATGGNTGSAIGAAVVASGGAVAGAAGALINPAQQRSNLNTTATNYIWGIVGSGYSGASRTSVLLGDFGNNRPTIREQQIENRRQDLFQRRRQLIYLEGQRADYENAVKSSELATEKLTNILVNLADFALTESEKRKIGEIYLEESGHPWAALIRIKLLVDTSRRNNVYTIEGQLRRDQEAIFIKYLLEDLSYEQALYKITHDNSGRETTLYITPENLRYYFDLSIAANALIDNGKTLSNIEFEIKQLEFEDIDPALDENPVHDARSEVQGVVLLSYSELDSGRQNLGALAPSVFQLTRQSDTAGSFFADLGQIFRGPSDGRVTAGEQGFDSWLSGSFSVLDDGSNVGRSGHSGNVSLGVAKRLSDRFSISGEIVSRFGKVDIDQILSETDFVGVGMSFSGAFAVTNQVILAATGFYEHGWFDTSLAGASGSFGADRIGVSVNLSGIFMISEFVLQPGVSVLYSESTLDSYTDSTAVFVPSQTTQYGNVNASLTVSRVLEGGGKLINWQPYVTGRLNHDFRREDRIAISPTLIINDSNTNGEIGGGIMFRFDGGTSATLGTSYFGLFGSGINFTKTGFNLNVPLN